MLNFLNREQKASLSEDDEKKAVRIACVDDNKIILSRTLSYVKGLLPDAQAMGFRDCDKALEFAKSGCDILFTEIELKGKPSGLFLAREIQKTNPHVNIIFTTVCSQSEYAQEVMQLRPSGYLTKVFTKQDVKASLDNLLYGLNNDGLK